MGERAYVVIILRLLVLYKKFQTFLHALRLDVATTPWPFLTSGSSFSAPSPSSLIVFADHFCFTVGPNDGHTGFRILHVPNLVSRIEV
jgi:hypothetical protein